MRPGTHAHRRLEDDVPAATKKARLAEIVATFREGAAQRSAAEIGRRHVVLVEGPSKRGSDQRMTGRTDCGKRTVFETEQLADALEAGQYVGVRVYDAGVSTLRAHVEECHPVGSERTAVRAWKWLDESAV